MVGTRDLRYGRDVVHPTVGTGQNQYNMRYVVHATGTEHDFWSVPAIVICFISVLCYNTETATAQRTPKGKRAKLF